MPFPDAHFDAAYAIDATVHAPSLTGVYSEIYRTLKPGGVFGVFEWVLTENFDPNNAEHVGIRYGIERGNGITSLQDTAAAQEAMVKAGFEIIYVEDVAKRPDPLPWWYPFSGVEVGKAQGLRDWALVIRNTTYGRVAVRFLVRALELFRVAPKGTAKITEELITAGDSLVAGGKKGIFTPMFLMVGKKREA